MHELGKGDLQVQLKSHVEDTGYPMINSRYMTFYRCGMGIGGSNTRFAFDRPAWRICNIGQLGLLVLFVSLATAVYAQNVNPGATQNPNELDCSDPLMASSSQCSGQNQQDLNSNLSLQARPQATPANGNYSDIDQRSRQTADRNQTQQPLPPPEPPTEFQRFVTSTTGQSLPI